MATSVETPIVIPAPGVSQHLNSLHTSQIAKLVSMVFRREPTNVSRAGEVRIVAVTSSQAGEGVTTLSKLIARELGKESSRQTLLAKLSDLEQIQDEESFSSELFSSKNLGYGYWEALKSPTRLSNSSSWNSDPSFRKKVMDFLRKDFDYVVLDCGPLKTSNDVPAIAALIDGILLVVQAGVTTKEEINHAKQLIQLAGGNLKGACLNRRTYPVPSSVYKWLRR